MHGILCDSLQSKVIQARQDFTISFADWQAQNFSFPFLIDQESLFCKGTTRDVFKKETHNNLETKWFQVADFAA